MAPSLMQAGNEGRPEADDEHEGPSAPTARPRSQPRVTCKKTPCGRTAEAAPKSNLLQVFIYAQAVTPSSERRLVGHRAGSPTLIKNQIR